MLACYQIILYVLMPNDLILDSVNLDYMIEDNISAQDWHLNLEKPCDFLSLNAGFYHFYFFNYILLLNE